MSKFYEEMYGNSGRCRTGHTFLFKILTFLNGCILPTIGSIYTKLGDFVNLGVLLLSCAGKIGTPGQVQRRSGFEWLCVNTTDWDQSQSDLPDVTLSMRRVTGSPWIADFRSWTWPEVAIPVANQKNRGLWERDRTPWYQTSDAERTYAHVLN